MGPLAQKQEGFSIKQKEAIDHGNQHQQCQQFVIG